MASGMTAMKKLVSILDGTDRVGRAAICPGGMMSMAVAEVMNECGARWPEAHSHAELMATLALAMQEATGFDCIALPFCMTVEAEAYGADVNLGSIDVQPRHQGWCFDAADDFRLPRPDFSMGRAGVTLAAMALARSMRPDIALIGNVVGPFSLLAMLTDPLQVMRWTRRSSSRLEAYLDTLADHLGAFARMQVEAGADVICIAEPTATGDILSKAAFRRFVLERVNDMARRISDAGGRVIVHICGDVSMIRGELTELCADAVSFDAMVNMTEILRSKPPWLAMGNVSAFKLAMGTPEEIKALSQRLVGGGVRLLAPACGIIAATSVANLKAMSETARIAG